MKVTEVSLLRYVWTPVHPEGYPFIGAFAVATLLLFALWEPLGWLGVLATVWCTYFFRDPERITPVRDGLIISPADGLVQMVGQVAPPPELEMGDEPRWRVSIFMSVFNVHVNRVPVSGRIAKIAYRAGKFVNAALDQASADNERNSLRIVMADGQDVGVVQIAGLVARRIKCDIMEGQQMRAGERYGLIRFGSRLDVYLPPGVTPLVPCGQIAIAGETVLADLGSGEGEREGEIR